MCFCEATSFPEANFFSIAWRTFYFSWKVIFENAQSLTSHVWLSSQEWRYLSMLICEKKLFQTLYFCSRHCHTYFKLFSNKICRTPLICLFVVIWVRDARPTFAVNLWRDYIFVKFFSFKTKHGFELIPSYKSNVWFFLSYVFWCEFAIMRNFQDFGFPRSWTCVQLISSRVCGVIQICGSIVYVMSEL